MEEASIRAIRPGERVAVVMRRPIGNAAIAAWLGTVVAVDAIGVRLTVDAHVPGQRGREPVPSAGEKFFPWTSVERLNLGGFSDETRPREKGAEDVVRQPI